jgi:hypothetical protein
VAHTAARLVAIHHGVEERLCGALSVVAAQA